MYRVLIGKGLAPAASEAAEECSSSSGGAAGRPTLLQLPCPATGAAQQFVLLPGGGGLLEVNRVRHEYGAWLVGDKLMSDGGCLLCSPIDPTYVLLGLLDSQQQQEQEAFGGGGGGGGGPSGMFQEAWPGAAALCELAAGALPLICDVRGSDEDKYYRLNDDKASAPACALAWLRCKLDQALAGLRAAAPGSVAGLEGDAARAYALGFMGEYLSPARLAQLSAATGLAPTGTANATPAVRQAPAPAPAPGHPFDDDDLPKDKARKVLDPKEAARRKQEEGRAEAKAARLAKQAEGTRKISSFFAAPGAKKK
ncbi:MAG: hypothetical protein J3K34DRAFT_522567 [Monoraphidium minutum]|nr:MAG: hypothetical protein J3K34DRAFT_522567 [Monoraphidium minutum]